MRPTIAKCLFAVVGLMAAMPVRATPAVLATIKPVHALVSAVMQGVGQPELLLRGAQSEHSYALKPSDAHALARARIIFEIGPSLESYLDRPIADIAAKAEIVKLEDAPGVRLLAARRGGLWESGESDSGVDPHIWLDPENAVAMTRTIATVLAAADPANRLRYEANGAREIANLRDLRQRLQRQLARLHGRSYLVFHDGYRYFENRFGLEPLGAVTVAPERPIGPRRMALLRKAILQDRIICVFREPQFSPRLIQTLVEGSAVKTGVLDPIGATLEPGPNLYSTLLENLAASLTDCLGGGHKNR